MSVFDNGVGSAHDGAKQNLAAIRAPLPTDDATKGYSGMGDPKGPSFWGWADDGTGKARNWMCESAAAGAAIWNEVAGSAVMPTLAAVATTGAYSDLTGKPTLGTASAQPSTAFATAAQGAKADTAVQPAAMSYASPARSLNSAFQISATRAAQVAYSLTMSCTAALIAGQSGTVTLEYADNSGMSTNVVTVGAVTNGAGGVLNIAVSNGVVLAGLIPAGKYVRLRTANNTGTPTYGSVTAQEVLL